MALRSTELQVILAATRDIEKIQQSQQQLPRWQQEQLTMQFRRELEERKRQAQALSKTRESQVKKIEVTEDRQKALFPRQKKKAVKFYSPQTVLLRNKQGQSLGQKSEYKIDLLV